MLLLISETSDRSNHRVITSHGAAYLSDRDTAACCSSKTHRPVLCGKEAFLPCQSSWTRRFLVAMLKEPGGHRQLSAELAQTT